LELVEDLAKMATELVDFLVASYGIGAIGVIIFEDCVDSRLCILEILDDQPTAILVDEAAQIGEGHADNGQPASQVMPQLT
jgi:hypothetical protein